MIMNHVTVIDSANSEAGVNLCEFGELWLSGKQWTIASSEFIVTCLHDVLCMEVLEKLSPYSCSYYMITNL